jgi:chemotaxis protein CheZ
MSGEANLKLQQVRDAVRSEVGELFADLRRFVDRRIAELSTEISATVELVDVSETALSGKLQLMQRELARVIALPGARTQNSDVDLETVVRATEEAANRIMTAAEAIRVIAARTAEAEQTALLAEVSAIFEACSFQDITGQRVRRAMQQLQTVEDELAGIMEEAGHSPIERARADKIKATAEITGRGPDLAQQDIDNLLAG